MLFIYFAFFPFMIFSNYYGQHLQDKYLNEVFFKNKINGYFVDLGSNNGIYINNSFFFEKNLNWKGLCVEPHPNLFLTLIENRTKSKCLNIGAGIVNGLFTFKKIIETCNSLDKDLPSCWSGILENYSESHAMRVDDWIFKFNATYELVTIDVLNINEILNQTESFDIDFLSMDIEGNELEILKAIDWKKFNIKVVLVENNDNECTFRNFMKTVDYNFITRIGFDDVYAKNGVVYDLVAQEKFFKLNPDSIINY